MQHNEPPAVERSLALYLALLRAYPPAFRERYGDEMALAFRDAARDALCQSGLFGLIALWARTVSDTVVNVALEWKHSAKEDVATPRWKTIAANLVVPIVIAIPIAAVMLAFLALNRHWLLVMPVPIRGWVAIIEAIALSLPVMIWPPKRAANRWSSIFPLLSLVSLFLWFPLVMSLGFGGWYLMAPMAGGSAAELFIDKQAKRLEMQTGMLDWRRHAGIACGACYLLMEPSYVRSATISFLLFVIGVNVVGALLSCIATKARSGNSEAI